jgi:hypothetical protein
LAPDNASFGDIANALSSRNYDFTIDNSFPGGFNVDTEKQLRGWMMMQIFNPETVGTLFSLGSLGMASRGSATVANNVSRNATLLNEVQVTAKASPQGFRAFTSSNFRFNLGKISDVIPPNSHAHHVFPQRYAPDFFKAGININDPKFGAWWKASEHLKNANSYNAVWKDFFMKYPNATQPQIFDKGRSMLQLYGLPVGF